MIVVVDYASPSALKSERDRNLLGLAPDRKRRVRFEATVSKEAFLFRVALQTLGKVIWSFDEWLAHDELMARILDPIITVHPDRLFFEAFSADQSVYGALIADRSLFSPRGETIHGTTNIDFTAWLAGALDDLRTSRETVLLVEPDGFEVKTTGAAARHEKKVDVPDDWVRGFLQLTGAMALPGTKLSLRPVDLLSALRFLQSSKAKISPRALRYEFPPGQEARIVLEPWEHVVPLKRTTHDYSELRVIRTWGRRRLHLLSPLLPFAESVDVYLKGRALPSFYVVNLPGMRFVLGLSGFSGSRFTESGSFDLHAQVDRALLERAKERLIEAVTIDPNDLAQALAIDRETANACLSRLVKLGLATYDVEARTFRHRELFAEPIDEAKLYPPDPRREAARKILAAGQVEVKDVSILETHQVKTLKTADGKTTRRITHRDWEIEGRAGERQVRIVVKDTGQIFFGRCECPFFAENLLNLGPCEHMLALAEASRDRRIDLPTSVRIPQPDA